MRIEFRSSVEGAAFMRSLLHELNARGVETEHRYLVSEAAYRKDRFWLSSLLLRLRLYVLYPLYLCGSLLGRRVRKRIRDTGYGIWGRVFFTCNALAN